jgi:hypothetical protein
MEFIKPKGTIKIFEGKKEKLLNVFHNDFMDAGRKKILNYLTGFNEQITYDFLAISDTDGAITVLDKKIENEVFRKEVTSVSTFDNKLIIDIFIDSFEANFTWKQVGLFVGGSVGTKDSGILFNKALIEQEKNSGKSLTISWEIEIV